MEDCPDWQARIELTLENWRRYLLDLNSRPQGVHHLFVVPGIPSEMPSNSHPKTLHYLLRAVDAVVLGGTRNLAVYVKLERSIFYAPIVPANPSGWEGTRIHVGPGKVISAKQRLSVKEFDEFLQSRVTLISPLSSRALTQIGRTIEKNPERFLRSETHRVLHASRYFWNLE